MPDLSPPAADADPSGPPQPRRRRWTFALVLTALLLGHLAVVWVTAIKPLPDLGFHVAAGSILRHTGEPGNRFSTFYDVGYALKPNALNLLWTACPLFPDALTASQVFYSVYVLAVPLLVLGIIRTLGGSPWLALGALPLLYNQSVAYGFTEFTGAIPLCLALLWALLWWERDDGWAPRLTVGGLLLGVYLAHAMASVFALMVCAAFIAWRYRRCVLDMARAALWGGPALAALLGWYALSPRGGANTSGWMIHYYRSRYIPGFPARVFDWLTGDNHALLGPVAGPMIAAGFVVALVGIATAGLVARRRRNRITSYLDDHTSDHEGATSGGGQAVGAWLIVSAWVMLAAPPGLPPYWSVYQRFVCFFLLGLIVIASTGWPAAARTPRPIVAALVLLSAIHLGLWLEHMVGYRADAANLRAIARHVDPAHVLGIAIIDPAYRGEPEAAVHAGDYLTPLRSAVVVSALYDYPFTPVRRAVGPARLPKFTDDPANYAQNPAIRQVLVRGVPDDGPFTTAYRLADRVGRWRLYERRGGGDGGGS